MEGRSVRTRIGAAERRLQGLLCGQKGGRAAGEAAAPIGRSGSLVPEKGPAQRREVSRSVSDSLPGARRASDALENGTLARLVKGDDQSPLNRAIYCRS